MLKTYLRILYQEMKITLLKLRRYPITAFTLAITLYVIFLGIFFGTKQFGVNFGDSTATGLVISYLFWSYTLFALNDPSESITEEISVGTLEQIYTSPVRPIILVYIRSIASFVNASLISLIVFLFAWFTTKVQINGLLLLKSLLLLIIVMVGIYGFGIALAGLTLRYKRIGQLGQIFNFVLLILAGIVVPIESMPYFLQKISMAIPLTQGVQLVKELIQVNSAWDVFFDIRFMGFIGLNIVYLLLGSAVFHLMNNSTRKSGHLGKY